MNAISMNRIGALVAIALLALAGCASESSSSTTVNGITGTIVGTVTNGSGSKLAGVTVSPSPALGPTVVTDASGKYSMPVVAGTYALTFAGDNLASATASNVAVEMDQTVTVDQVMQASPLTVTVNLPPAYKFGGPTGFGTAVTGITATVKMNGSEVSSAGVSWSVKEFYGVGDPPSPVTLTSETGSTTGFTTGDFETLRESANAWLNELYGTTGTESESEYIRAPERDQLLSFGVQQVRAMSYKVIAKVTSNGLTSTGSAVVSPVTINSGIAEQPLGMMIVGNAPCTPDKVTAACTATYAWTLKYLPSSAPKDSTWGALPEGTSFQGADTRNPTIVTNTAGNYQLQNGTDAPLVFRVSTYHGSGMKASDTGGDDGFSCYQCHHPDTANPPDPLKDRTLKQFPEWAKSAHANANFADPSLEPMSLFKLGLSGGEGSHYGESCISCHTVGYSKVPTAVNGGFDDEMVADPTDPWTFPTPPEKLDPTFAAWNDMPAQLKHMGAIECESCHGPLEPNDHGSVGGTRMFDYGSALAPKASMDAGVCLVCHDSFPSGSPTGTQGRHDKGPLWAASGHSNTDLAIEEGSGSKSCARCHSAEGFMIYLPLQQNDTPGQITDAQLATLKGMTLHPQTCQTCHDPHSTELRVEGDTHTVAAMFRIQNAGAGALCMVCHNSRSDAVKANGFAFVVKDLGRLGPHAAAQGDMFAGRNAFFMDKLTSADGPTNLPYLSAHAFLADTCVDCHVKWVPPDIQAQYMPAGTNHTFKASLQVCANCHAEGIGEKIQESVGEKMATLKGRVSDILSAKLLKAGFQTAIGARKDPANTSKTLAEPASRNVAAADVRSIVARQDASAVVVTLTNGSQFYVGIGNICAVDATPCDSTPNTGTVTALLNMADPSTQTMLKAYFNLLYVNNDGAKGIHNPAFAAAVLDNATAALSATVIP